MGIICTVFSPYLRAVLHSFGRQLSLSGCLLVLSGGGY